MASPLANSASGPGNGNSTAYSSALVVEPQSHNLDHDMDSPSGGISDLLQGDLMQLLCLKPDIFHWHSNLMCLGLDD